MDELLPNPVPNVEAKPEEVIPNTRRKRKKKEDEEDEAKGEAEGDGETTC